MVLSTEDRGSYAPILGGAMTMDAFNAVAVAPDMTELVPVLPRGAWRRPGVDPSDVAYLNAHGPGTAQCDAAEAAHARRASSPRPRGIFSVKPLVGHCQAAAAAVEILATIYAFQTGLRPGAAARWRPGHPRLVDGLTPRRPGPDGEVVHRHGRATTRPSCWRRTRGPHR